MTESVKPIFVVGAPRSGTSILTWSLGRHPNTLPFEESNWLDRLALDSGTAYGSGARIGERSQIKALGISRAQFYEHIGDAINSLVLSPRIQLPESSWFAERRTQRREVPAGR